MQCNFFYLRHAKNKIKQNNTNQMFCVSAHSVWWHIFYCYYRDYDRRIYHLVSSPEIKVSWKELIDCGRWIIVNRLPLNGVVWYPGGSMKSNRLLHNICCILFHWIPAILIDCLLFCLRYPPVWVKRSMNIIFLVFSFCSLFLYPVVFFPIYSIQIDQLINCQLFPDTQAVPCTTTNPKRFWCFWILHQQSMGFWQQQCTLYALNYQWYRSKTVCHRRQT